MQVFFLCTEVEVENLGLIQQKFNGGKHFQEPSLCLSPCHLPFVVVTYLGLVSGRKEQLPQTCPSVDFPSPTQTLNLPLAPFHTHLESQDLISAVAVEAEEQAI